MGDTITQEIIQVVEIADRGLTGPAGLPVDILAAAPASPTEGYTYYNTTDHKLWFWNGTAWVDVTDAETFDGQDSPYYLNRDNHTGPSASKATPVDADNLLLLDSAASNVAKKLSWANIKANLVSTKLVLEPLGETESMPRNADTFAAFPNGWVDESTGGTNPPRVFSERMSTGTIDSCYTVFESTGGTNLLQITSPPFTINSNETWDFRLDARTFGGTPSINAYIIGYEQGGNTSTGYIQILTGKSVTSGSWETIGLSVNPAGGSAPALPANCDRAVIQLTLATNNAIKIGIRNVYFGRRSLYAGGTIQPTTGGHEAVFDGTNLFQAIFFSGYIAKMNLDGTFVENICIGGGVNVHQIISDGSYLYCAEWDAMRITKRAKTPSATPVASVSATSQVFGVCILDGYLYAPSVDKKMYKIRMSDFTLTDTFTITAMNNSTTEATPIPLNGYIWLHTTQDGKVLKIDPATGTVVTTINPPAAFGTSLRNYGFGELAGKLYLSFHNGTIVEYDPATSTISNQWFIGGAATSQLKSDGTSLWFVGQTPSNYLVRFNPTDGAIFIPTRQSVSVGSKWCEVVNDEVWCGGLGAARTERYRRF